MFRSAQSRTILLASSRSKEIGFSHRISLGLLQSRISFAAVGSGLNFLKHPDIQTSPGYRAYAISSFALFSKYLLDYEIGAETLENPDLEAKLKKLNKDTWKLSQ